MTLRDEREIERRNKKGEGSSSSLSTCFLSFSFSLLFNYPVAILWRESVLSLLLWEEKELLFKPLASHDQGITSQHLVSSTQTASIFSVSFRASRSLSSAASFVESLETCVWCVSTWSKGGHFVNEDIICLISFVCRQLSCLLPRKKKLYLKSST